MSIQSPYHSGYNQLTEWAITIMHILMSHSAA